MHVTYSHRDVSCTAASASAATSAALASASASETSASNPPPSVLRSLRHSAEVRST